MIHPRSQGSGLTWCWCEPQLSQAKQEVRSPTYDRQPRQSHSAMVPWPHCIRTTHVSKGCYGFLARSDPVSKRRGHHLHKRKQSAQNQLLNGGLEPGCKMGVPHSCCKSRVPNSCSESLSPHDFPAPGKGREGEY